MMLAIFETIAVILWLTKKNLFYLLNFSYIGIAISLGLFLYAKKIKGARRAVQFLVGTYMLVYLGLISKENMQIEGFWYYLFLGAFEAAIIHYAIAKIFGPLLFGRGWCGYACWTAMILDLLPYKTPKGPRKNYGFVRYITFISSFIFVCALFLLRIDKLERIMFRCFLFGNLIYYAAGIVLACLFQDNRAFCKVASEHLARTDHGRKVGNLVRSDGSGHGNNMELRFTELCFVAREIHLAKADRLVADLLCRVNSVFISFYFAAVDIESDNVNLI